ncbi:MAG: flagellar motor protein MotD [SAR86 cluster bacterium]|uniref:Flagellar motor protein MotD n=1 Tax=SAR86 cluster bacterium TaxID=2030880 RepID=A0A2A5B5A0_9GAMM|nr:MAG: flagellar motor protein MotD [SAR86 cluster bacterium]
MPRRQKHRQEPQNHERWLVSYADFITLLFAFFVVLYSMSSVNEGKYRVLSDSMVAAFTQTTRSLTPIQVGELVRTPPSPIASMDNKQQSISLEPLSLIRAAPVIIVDPDFVDEEKSRAEEEISDQIDSIANSIEETFDDLILDDQVSVRRSPFWLEVVFNSSILFGSGSANLSDSAVEPLARLGALLSDRPNQISVEGFTDNNPIVSPIFPSNWELSSARAAAVVRLFEDNDISSDRLSSVGFGENRPVSENITDVGRANNRRVIVVIMADTQSDNDDEKNTMSNQELFRQRLN